MINAPRLYRIDPVDDQPCTLLQRWRIFSVRLASGVRERHLVGYAPAEAAGRVSTAIVGLDLSSRRATTRSGRIYLLEGEPEYDDEGQWLWEKWLAVRSVSYVQDVTRAWTGAHLGAKV
uniref:hypothetical protein n=1 Tax=Hylemonella sp. TaxID=2066020 RepID=UPI0035B0C5ED